MREVVILSGKGGTGKTSITASLAAFTKRKVVCDADVDAADLHLLMQPKHIESSDFQGGFQAQIDLEKCVMCGTCNTLCQFDAIDTSFVVDSLSCEGCGVCVEFCQVDAIEFSKKTNGKWYISETRFGSLVHARLGIAEENSGKLVTLVRNEARKLAMEKGLDLIITDGPPGIGCPVIASMGQATAVLVVVEPSISGIHDMHRLIDLTRKFRIPALVCINKYDLNLDQSEQITEYCKKHKIPFLGKIPYDPIVTKAMVNAQTVMEYDPNSKVSKAIKEIWFKLIQSPEMNVVTEIRLN